MRKTVLWMAMLLIVATAAGAEQRVNETRAVEPDAKISIENVAGSLTVVGVDGGEVRVSGTMGDDIEELEIRGGGDDLSIEVVIPDEEWGRQRKLSADLEVEVPRGVDLEIETVSATIDIRDVVGEIDAASVSGAVTVTGAAADVEAVSVSGAVTVRGGRGTIVAESVSGKLLLEGVSGDLEATTVSGEIRVEAGEIDDVELESVAGSVFFQGRLGAGSLEVDSHSGNVELHLPADLSAEFELETFSGRIDNGFGPPAQRVDRYAPGMSAEFSTGSGDAEVTVETFSGNIVLKQF